MFLTSGSLLGSLGHPWEPLGPPSVSVVFLLSTLRVLLGGFWSSSGTIFTFLLFVCHVFSFLYVIFISFRVCFPGRPDSRMYCPDIIGRGSWVWDEQKTLYKTIPPTGWGNNPSRQLLSTRRS